MRSPSDSEEGLTTTTLISRSQRGDLSAFRLLMESHQRYAYAVAFRLLHDVDGAKDAVQDAFIRVWKNLHAYRQDVKFTTWLYKIVVNLCYDRMKMESRRTRSIGFTEGSANREEVATGHDPGKETENADLCERILSEAKKLPPKQRLVFQLRDVQDFSPAEIAGMTGLTVNTVKANLCYARQRIRLAVMNAGGGRKQ